jgi:ferredoxin
MKRSDDVALRLRVDPVACEGIGLCAHLAPSVVDLDRWGYPVVPSGDLTDRETGAARNAVRACPRRALWLEAPRAPLASSDHTAGW